MELSANENELVGQWIFENGKVINDPVADRIGWLIKNKLKKIGVASGGWEALFIDPGSGRLWERSFPNSGLHGGGPPSLTSITKEDAVKKYDIKSL